MGGCAWHMQCLVFHVMQNQSPKFARCLDNMELTTQKNFRAVDDGKWCWLLGQGLSHPCFGAGNEGSCRRDALALGQGENKTTAIPCQPENHALGTGVMLQANPDFFAVEPIDNVGQGFWRRRLWPPEQKIAKARHLYASAVAKNLVMTGRTSSLKRRPENTP